MSEQNINPTKEHTVMARRIIALALQVRFPELSNGLCEDGTIQFTAPSTQTKEEAEQFNKEIGKKVDNLLVAETRLVNYFSAIVELKLDANHPWGALALAFADIDQAPAWRSTVLLFWQDTVTINNPGTAEARSFWTNTVAEMRRFYNTDGLIKFQSST